MLSYVYTPFLAWLTAGSLKFIINSIKAKQLAWGHIGYGGLPSNHSAIVSSSATLIALREGVNNPAFSVALTLAFIVILDASSLRQEVGKHAAQINRLSPMPSRKLRERMGHTAVEIAAGICVGITVAIMVFTIKH